jgi:membrane fusion protein (multidrug efflux system)
MTEGAAGFSSRRTRLLVVGLGAIVLLVLAIALLRGTKIAPGLLARPVAVTPNAPLGHVVVQTVPRMREVVGSVQSRHEVDAASRVMATVREVRVRAGDRIRKGETLVVLDSGDLRGALATAEGALAAANANLVRATQDEKRFRFLVKRGSVTRHEFDAVEAAYHGALAQVAGAKGQVASARAALNYAVVTSPVTGVVDERLVEPGDLAVPGRPLVRVYDSSALRVELRVPEQLIKQIRVGTSITVRVDAAGLELPAIVNEIVPVADPASRTFLVRAPLAPNSNLRPGMFARAALAAGTEKVLTVERHAVESVGQLQMVRVLKDGTVQVRQVTTGRAFGKRIEVLSGLAPGETVLLGNRDLAEHE